MIVYRGYQIKPYKEVPTALIVATEGQGGKIPDCLAGMFTSTTVAKRDIDNYLDNRGKKKNETVSEG
jgi:hypothetical protein